LVVGVVEEVVVAGVVVLKAVELLGVEDEDVEVDAGTVIDGDGGGSKGFWSSGGALSFPSSFVPNTRTEFAGMGPIALDPYASAEGITSNLSSPIHIPNNPSSQPLITCPVPTLNVNGSLRV